MSLSAYMADFRTALAECLRKEDPNPLPVVEGPIAFALNSQRETQFVAVSETTIGYEPSDSLTMYKMPIEIQIGIHVEAGQVKGTMRHLIRARQSFDAIWKCLGGMRSSHFQVIRDGAERLETDDASSVDYVITATLHVTAKDTNCG